MEVETSEAVEEPKKLKEENGDAAETTPESPPKKVFIFFNIAFGQLSYFSEFHVQYR